MLALASVLLSTAAIACLSARGLAWLGVVSAGLASFTCVRAWGFTEGLMVELMLAMTAASALVLMLPPNKSWTRPLALCTAALGTVSGAWGVWS